MKLQFDRSVLQQQLHSVQGVASRKSTIPALSYVLLTREGDGCRLSATDLNIAMRSTFDIVSWDVAEGAVLLPAEKLYQIVQALPPGQDVTIEFDGKIAKVSCGGFSSKLNVLPAADFPPLPEEPVDGGIYLPRAILREMVRKTRFALSADDTRFYLAGSQLAFANGAATMVATDGHRLTHVVAPLAGEDGASILPAATLKELVSMLDGDGEEVRFRRGENHLFFNCGSRLLISRVIDAQFPAFEKIIPKGNDKRALIPREPLQAAVNRVAIMADSRSRAVEFTLENGKIGINCVNAETGEAADSVAAEYDGTPISMKFNAKYLQDFLSAVDGEKISVELKDELSQALFKAVGADGYDYSYILMPMRI
jgi:DNA polymerase-3 subunit beta